MLRFARNDLFAFTLAEVLVTLGIIGVVSAMTVPSLMQNYQRQSYVTQLHKVYNEMSQAAMQYLTQRNALNMKEAGFTSQQAAENFIETGFKVINKCGADKTPCFAPMNEYKKLSGKTITSWMLPRTHYTLASGASIGIAYRTFGDTVLAEIFVDINGQKGPNIVGRDLFNLFLYNNGSFDDLNTGDNAPLTNDVREETFTSICQAGDGGSWHGCFGKILNDNWQMTY